MRVLTAGGAAVTTTSTTNSPSSSSESITANTTTTSVTATTTPSTLNLNKQPKTSLSNGRAGGSHSNSDSSTSDKTNDENRPPTSFDEDDDLSSSDGEEETFLLSGGGDRTTNNKRKGSSNTNDDDDEEKNYPLGRGRKGYTDDLSSSSSSEIGPDDLYNDDNELHKTQSNDVTIKSKPTPPRTLLWLAVCFFGIMFSFVSYGLLLEYATSGGRKLHELSFLFVTSSLYTLVADAFRHIMNEKPTTIPPARFAVLGLTSMGSTFCSVRSLRYVIFPIQVLAKSCKPVPVMIFGAFMGKTYPLRKYLNVCLIVAGVGLFMGGGDTSNKNSASDDTSSSAQIVGIILLFISLCFDGGTGAYEDKLMSVHEVGPFDLMYNIQLGKTIIAFVGLLVFNQVHIFVQMCREMGFVLVALGLTGAMGQVFIFVTISKFGALTCSIIGLARKVTTLVASIYFYGHSLNGIQATGLTIAVGAMVMNFRGKKDKGGGGGHGHGGGHGQPEKISQGYKDTALSNPTSGGASNDLELAPVKPIIAGGTAC